MKRSDEPVVDEHGKASYKWQYVGTYKVDVQPITQEKCKRMFGAYPNVKYEVWLEDAIDDFNTTDFKVIYKNKEYEIDKNTFLSKGKNTPFHGRKVKGEVAYTLVIGNVVYER